MAISFSTYDLPNNPLANVENVKHWIIQVAERKGFKVGRIEYLFSSDIYIHSINREFLGHDYPTDIITFDYSIRRKISGDVLIGIPVVQNNSERFGVSFFEELLRVIIHGALHLMGFPDYTEGEKNLMREEEDKALRLYYQLF
ncbi:MAG: rRNA maturation RNase YbeY [Bacteroidota bacterium]